MDVEKGTEHLIRAILDSETYQSFEIQRDKLKGMPELKIKINEFRIRNYELQNSEHTEDLFDRMDALESEYAAFRENPVVEDFLTAELKLCRLMQEVYARLTEAVDLEF